MCYFQNASNPKLLARDSSPISCLGLCIITARDDRAHEVLNVISD